MTQPATAKIKLQIICGDTIAFGPGKADLLDAIRKTGSISGAARAMGMSYRRAWLLVDTMNRCWQQPLVVTHAGGPHGGASVSEAGLAVMADYRAWQAAVAQAGATCADQLTRAVRDTPLDRQPD